MSFADYAFAVWAPRYGAVHGFALALGLPLGARRVAGDKTRAALASGPTHGPNALNQSAAPPNP